MCQRQKTIACLSQLHTTNDISWLNISFFFCWVFLYSIYIYMYEDFFPQFHSNIAIFPTLDGPGPWNQRVKKSLRKPRFLRFCYLVNVYQGISCYLNKSTWHHACITLPGWPILKCRLWWYNCIKML